MRPTVWMMGLCVVVGCGTDEGSATGSTAGTESGLTDASTGETANSASQSGTTEADTTRTTTGGTMNATSESADTGFLFDVGSALDTPAQGCDCGEASTYSYIWIANSPESTVTKINTETMEEEGRYLTRADAAGNPSRTSVSISGRAVAVANRHGGVVKVWANEADCIESNGMPGIQTSDGAGNVLTWGEDECVHWYRDFPGYTVQRPIAWAPGEFNESTCQWENELIWTAGCGNGGSPGFGGETTTHVHLLDGETGLDVMTVDLPDYTCTGFGPYGGAVDSHGNFWMQHNNNQLAVVYRDDFSHQVWEKAPDVSPYGLTVDSQGRPWVTSYSGIGAARFDPVTETWEVVNDPIVVGNGQSGIAQASDGKIWMGVSGPGVASIDPETLQIIDHFVVPGVQGKGISVDAAGFVWRAGGSTASRIDPADGTATHYMGLNGAYTYSDMTGLGVANASGCSPAG